ncbi:MAG: glycosyltransferase [Anaerolineae bacterium]|nr:glycosyltransferase [Anaerolineae bacterium]
MNILHIYKDYHPVLGGIENHVRLLAEAQAAQDHQVAVLVTSRGARTEILDFNGVRVVKAARLATIASTPVSFALPWQLLRQRPDVVHLHFPYPVGEVSQWLLRRGRATVLTYHADIVRQATILRFYLPLMRQVLRFVNAIIIASPPMRASTYLTQHQAKLRLIPYGIPLERFRAAPPEPDLARARALYLPDAPPSPTLLFVGRLRYYKGLDTLIQSLSQVPARLLVAGSGPMAETWQALARATGVAERIAWLGDVLDEDLPALYHLADLFVLPASHTSEAFGLVQVEAMAAGLPVVCTELGTGTSYVNLHGETGLVVPPRDPQALAAAINTLLADAGLRARMGEAGRRRAAREFNLPAMVERVLTLYGDLRTT